MGTIFKFLKFTRLREIDFLNLSVQFNTSKSLGFTDKYDFVHLSDLLKLYREPITIEDNITYRRVRVKTNNGGIEQRDTEIGKNIGTKKQFIARPGLFIISKIDARNGSLGIVPDELDGAIVTNDFPLYSIDKSKVNPKYITYVVTSKRFVQNVQGFSNGTTNRQRVDLNQFLSQKIPLPSLSVQDQLVADYEDKISRAQTCEEQAKNLETEIQNYLNEKLGIQRVEKKEVKSKGLLKFVRLKEVDAWSVDKLSTTEEHFVDSNYKLLQLGNVVKFITRRWTKKTKTFKYIELSSIDESEGIIDYSEIETKDAPSRATQIVDDGDLIVGLTRPYLKKFAIVDKIYSGDVCSSGFQVIQKSENYNNSFICEFLKTDYAIKQFQNFMTGALYPAITSKDLRNVVIPLPSKEEQDEFMNHISSLKEKIKQLKSKAIELKQQALEEFENEIFE